MKKIRRRRIMIGFVIAAAVVIAGFSGYLVYKLHKLNQLTKMSFEDMVEYTTGNNPDAVITVGIIKDGKATTTAYGENGKKLPNDVHTYEIGSITKTFTATLISKAVEEGKIKLSDSVDKYLELPHKEYYPTIEELLTHTSGYKAYYFEPSMISNHFKGMNDFYGISKDIVMKKLSSVNIKDKEYSFKYSNFGFATLGLVLEKVYHKDYTELVNEFVKDELGLLETRISDGKGENGSLDKHWEWKEDDAYLAAGGLVSNIDDMLKYARLQLEGKNTYISATHEPLNDINASTSTYEKMGIYMDSIGMAWIMDKEKDIVWHNGGTGDYNSYIGLDLEDQVAVVVLSNLAPDYRIPATVMGVKLLKSMQ